jgi:hypothetical protein
MAGRVSNQRAVESTRHVVVDDLRFRVRPDLADLTLVRDDGGTLSFGTLSELGNFLAEQDQLEAGTV